MIANGKAITHGNTALRYDMREDKLQQIVDVNLIDSTTPDEILHELEAVNEEHTRCKNRYLRFELGIAKEDEMKMTPERLQSIVHKFSEKMGLQKQQWIAVTHKDTAHLHIHILANRIGIDGTTYKTDFLGNRSARAAEEISRELGLVIANDINRKKKYTDDKSDPHRLQTRGKVEAIAHSVMAENPATLKAFIVMLREKGVDVQPVHSQKDNRVYGLRFKMAGQTFKASDIGREFGLGTLQKTFGNAPQVPPFHEHKTSGVAGDEKIHSVSAVDVITDTTNELIGSLFSFDPQSEEHADIADEMELRKLRRKKKKRKMLQNT